MLAPFTLRASSITVVVGGAHRSHFFGTWLACSSSIAIFRRWSRVDTIPSHVGVNDKRARRVLRALGNQGGKHLPPPHQLGDDESVEQRRYARKDAPGSHHWRVGGACLLGPEHCRRRSQAAYQGRHPPTH